MPLLPFFPSPYPDETFYSIIARYHQRSGNGSVEQTMRELFRSPKVGVKFEFPDSLQVLCDQLQKDSLNTPNNFIYNHTLFNLYSVFIFKEIRERAINSMISGSTKLYNILGVNGDIKSASYLRYCPECAESDLKKYQQPYWHRMHQVPMVFICHLHKTFLIESNVSMINPRRIGWLMPLSQDIIQQSKNNRKNVQDIDYHIDIANSVYWLLNNQVHNGISNKELRNKYLFYLQTKNMLTLTGDIMQQALASSITSFYGETFLQDMNSTVSGDSNRKYWLNNFLSGPRNKMHPIRHIILMNYLGIEPKEFFSDEEKNIKPNFEEEPFGKGPWPCLNPAASHFKENIVTQCSIRINVNKKFVGRFSCECGYVYTRLGPDKCKSDRYKVSRVVIRGNAFWEKVNYLREQGNIFNVIAKQLNIDRDELSVKYNKYKHSQNPDVLSEVISLKRKEHRDRIIKTVHDNPDISRSELKKICAVSLRYLSRYDHEWLYEHLPLAKESHKQTSSINWNNRDDELYEKVKKAYEQLFSEIPLVRISRQSLINHIGEKCSKWNPNMQKIPRTNALICEISETREEFQKRKLRYAAKKIIDNGQNLTKTRLIEVSGIGKHSNDIDKLIESIVNADG